MDIMTETSNRIEELEEENKKLKEKLDKCRKLLKIAADDLEKQADYIVILERRADNG